MKTIAAVAEAHRRLAALSGVEVEHGDCNDGNAPAGQGDDR